MIFVTILLLAIVSAVNYLIHRDVLYPAFIQSALWTIVLLLLLLNAEMLYPLGPVVLGIVVVGSLSFSIGAHAATFNYQVERRGTQAEYVRADSISSWVLFFLPIIMLPFLVYKAISLVEGGPGLYGIFLRDLRHTLNYERDLGGYGIAAYLAGLAYLNLGIQLLIGVHSANKFRIVVAFLVAAAYAVFSTGRGFFFLIFSLVIGILLITRRVKSAPALLAALSYCAVTFAVIAVVMGKGGDIDASMRENVETIGETFLIYLLAPLPSFDRFIADTDNFEYGSYVFRTVTAIARAVGFQVEVKALVQDFVYVPVASNVYTIYHPYYADFGIFGAIISQLLIGFWHGFLYRKADTGKLFYVFLYALFSYPLIMQFFHDQYFTLMSLWLQLIGLAFVYLYAFKQVNRLNP